MKLYHGTSAAYLDDILKNGIQPPRQTGLSNWEQAPSHEDMVYLSMAYPFFFAHCACNEEENQEHYLVFEIDSVVLDEESMCPDEDFIAFFLEKEAKKLEQPIQDLRAEAKALALNNPQLWQESLTWLGNCSYRGTLPSAALTRYVLFAPEARPQFILNFFDPSISPLNYSVKGPFYRQLVSWFFGDCSELPIVPELQEQLAALEQGESQAEGALLDQLRQSIAFWEKESQDRTGIAVYQSTLGVDEDAA